MDKTKLFHMVLHRDRKKNTNKKFNKKGYKRHSKINAAQTNITTV